MESYEEACIELSVAIKKAIRHWGQGRPELVKAVNAYFGWDPDGDGKSRSIHMLNHYLSKPAEYPIPAPCFLLSTTSTTHRTGMHSDGLVFRPGPTG